MFETNPVARWLWHRPVMLIAVVTAVCVAFALRYPPLGANPDPLVVTPLLILMRVNEIFVGGLAGHWLFWLFVEFGSPPNDLEPWTWKWLARRLLLIICVVGGALAYAVLAFMRR